MQNNSNLCSDSKEAHLKMLYAVHDIADNIDGKIAMLNHSAGNNNQNLLETERLENTKKELHCKHIQLIKFSVMLPYEQEKVLEMRCEQGMSWKSIAAALHMGVATVKQMFSQTEAAAEQYGGIF